MSKENNKSKEPNGTDVISNINHSPLTAMTLVKTCPACPSQWEGKLKDGRMYYVRYRWGCLEATISKDKTDDVMDAVGGEELHYDEQGDDFDGAMDTHVMKERLSKVLSFKDCDDT